MARTKEEQIVFLLGPPAKERDPPPLVFGISDAAWAYMQGGLSHDFDFRGVGVNLQALIFRGTDHADIMRQMEEAASRANVPIVDERRRDFSVKDREDD